jgi:cyclic-di-GMP-binding protein
VKNSFFLVIPPQIDDSQALMSYSEAALLQWLGDLPAGNAGLSTRLLQDRIAELISLTMPPPQRLSCLEVLRPYYLRLDEALRARLISNRFPKSESEQKIAYWMLLIEKQFTIGYWMVVQELTRRNASSWLNNRLVVLSMHRTLKGLAALVVSHATLGYKVPEWVWYDIHALYQLAVKHDKHNLVVTDESDRIVAAAVTIEHIYRQILLFSLIAPAGLMQKEMLPVYSFLSTLTPLLAISRQPIAQMPVQCVLILDEDLPPRFLEADAANIQRNDNRHCYLDLSRLQQLADSPADYASAFLERYNAKPPEIGTKPMLSYELFDYLNKRWLGSHLHGDEVFQDRLDRLMVVGLELIHDWLSANQDPQAQEMLAETRSASALCCESVQEGLLSVGSLVGLRKAMEPTLQSRSLAVICKLHLNPVGPGLVFEVRQLADSCFPVHFSAPRNDGQEPYKALLYTLNDRQQLRSYIVLESVVLQEEDVINLYMSSERFPIVLKNRRNIGLGYWQFECLRIQHSDDTLTYKKNVYDFT